jgi:DNA polymerase-3 subunit alpha
MAFAHLHVHSQYSLLDGLNTVQRIVEKAVALGMPAVALTDHGVMYRAVDFYNAAVAAKIRSIIGLEGCMAARGMTDRGCQAGQTFHASLDAGGRHDRIS